LFSFQIRSSLQRQSRIIRHCAEHNISSSGENWTTIGEYSTSYSASAEDQMFEREDEMWNEVTVLPHTGLVTQMRIFFCI